MPKIQTNKYFNLIFVQDRPSMKIYAYFVLMYNRIIKKCYIYIPHPESFSYLLMWAGSLPWCSGAFSIVASEFELQSCYYLHFGKGMNTFVPPAMG